MSDAPLRLFTALWPGPVTRSTLHAWSAAQPWLASARPVRPVDLHLTLHFLGEVPASRLPELCGALHTAPHRGSLVLDRCSRFDGGALVLEPSAVPETLLALQRQLTERLRALGLTPDRRRWRPHVTLARRAQPQPALSVPALAWRSQGHVLVASRPGSPYQVLQRFGQ